MQEKTRKIVFYTVLFVAVTALAAGADLLSKSMAFDALGVWAEKGMIFNEKGPLMVQKEIQVEGSVKKVWELPQGDLPTIEVLGETFRFIPAVNLGGMWGFLAGHTIILILFSIVCMGIIGYMVVTVKRHDLLMRLSLALILGGAIGNLYDRLVFGGVRDFLDLDLGFMRWPTFNVADIWIVVGVGLIFVLEIAFGKKPEEKKTETKKPSDMVESAP